MADAQLIQYLERIEAINEEIAEKTDDRKDVFREVKAQGYDTKLVRAIIALRAMDPEKRREYQALLDTYMDAAGLA